MKNRLHFLAAAVAGLAAPSCSLPGLSTPRGAYHLLDPVQTLMPADYENVKQCSSGSCELVMHDGVKLCHVETDDQGEIFSHDQLRQVTDAIRAESRKEKLLVLVFVHGWKNNSSGEGRQSHAMEQFTSMLHRLADANRQLGRQPLGVMVSWRGRTSTLPMPIPLDYFHRNEAARRKSVSTTELLYDIGLTAKNANESNRVVMVGHSMGGLILESAVNEAIGAEIVRRQRAGITLDKSISPADLIVLANSAENALPAKSLISLMRNRGVVSQVDGRKAEVPLIVSVSSEKDSATRFIHAGANIVARLLPFSTSSSGRIRNKYEPTETVDPEHDCQFRLWMRAPPHVPSLRSHEDARKPGDKHELLQSDAASIGDVIKANAHPELEADGSFHYETKLGRIHVKRKPAGGSFNNTPYWVFRVNTRVIGGHSDIWNDHFIGLVATLMNLRGEPAARALQQPDGVRSGIMQQFLPLNLRKF